MAHEQHAFTWWKAALADPSKIGSDELPIHDSEPFQGFYRTRESKGARYSPIAFWYEDGVLNCHINGKPVSEQRARGQWVWSARQPISHAAYLDAVAGKPWADEVQVEQPDGTKKSSQERPARQTKPKAEATSAAAAENPRAVIGSNSGSAAQEVLDEVREWERELAKLTKAAITTQPEADKLADIKDKLAKLQKSADDQRKEEKQPYLDEGRRIDSLWNPVVQAADQAKRRATDHLTVFQKAQREEARRRQEEEQRRLAEAASASGGDDAPGAPAAQPEEPKVSAGTGRRATLVKRKVVVVDDFKAVGGYFLAQDPINADLREVLAKLANRVVLAGITVPGARETFEERSR